MDTTTGHWEMMGIVTERPFPTYPNGFPQEVIDAFAERTGRGVIGNVAGLRHGDHPAPRRGAQRTGDWIVYTSADSVFQIAAHEEDGRLDRTLRVPPKAARGLLTGGHAVGRVIARPFAGAPGSYVRTPRRHDYSLTPPRPNHLQRLREGGVRVEGVGIGDIFAGADIDRSTPTASNAEGIERTAELVSDAPDGTFVFVNLVETDMIWGHRNDPDGFAGALREIDAGLASITAGLRPGDLLLLTSDHGCDPTTPGTDHTREHGLLVAHVAGTGDGRRREDGDTFADIGATVQRVLLRRHDDDLPGTPVL